MAETFRSMQVTEPGRLELVERPVPHPEAGQVLIAVEACGICGADRGDIENADPAANRVPGHEVVGRIVARGANVPAIWRVGGERGVIGSITGSPYENERTLGFSVLTGVRPRIETMPLERAGEAYRKMRSGDVRFRMVLTMGDRSNAHQ